MATTKPRVYIDACPVIDMVKMELGKPLTHGGPAEAERRREVAFLKSILEASKDRELECWTSTLTVAECLHVEGQISDKAKDSLRRILTSGQYVFLHSPSHHCAIRARDLHWEDGINLRGGTGRGGADYIHVASALELGCVEFLTTDGRGMLREAQKLKLLRLDVRKPSETRFLSDARRQLVIPNVLDIKQRPRKGRVGKAAATPES